VSTGTQCAALSREFGPRAHAHPYQRRRSRAREGRPRRYELDPSHLVNVAATELANGGSCTSAKRPKLLPDPTTLPTESGSSAHK
jgi:hypothetical protein